MIDNTYITWLIELKGKIRSAQIKASLAVNSALISFYWEMGKMIAEKEAVWGNKLIDKVSNDLKNEFPNMQGLSTSNLKYCKRFYLFYHTSIGQQAVDQLEANASTNIGQQLVDQIPWGHNILIFSRSKEVAEAQFYIQKTIENNWSRSVLQHQIESKLFERQGKAITNFKNTLPEASSDLANQLLKDPYQFDFLMLTENYKERELENFAR